VVALGLRAARRADEVHEALLADRLVEGQLEHAAAVEPAHDRPRDEVLRQHDGGRAEVGQLDPVRLLERSDELLDVLRLVGQHGLDQLVRGREARVVELAVEQLARDRAVLLGGQQRDRVLLLVAQVEVDQRPLDQQRQRNDALVGRDPQALALRLGHGEVDRHLAAHLLVAEHRDRLHPPVAPRGLVAQQHVGGLRDVARALLDHLARPRHGGDGVRGRGRP
jgi:hypothetical protein